MATTTRMVQYKEKKIESAPNNPLPRPPREGIFDYNAYANDAKLTVEEWTMRQTKKGKFYETRVVS